KRRFSTEKTRVHHTWLEIKDRAYFARFFLVSSRSRRNESENAYQTVCNTYRTNGMRIKPEKG
ncbi:hypothetical protein, partial [Sporolactobacillus terrae]|uniref:hypothetical protein n=1 Tax=Sporolactobacillus terrae TaxID=269673 RepID=UPI001F3352D1